MSPSALEGASSECPLRLFASPFISLCAYMRLAFCTFFPAVQKLGAVRRRNRKKQEAEGKGTHEPSALKQKKYPQTLHSALGAFQATEGT